MVFKTPQQCIGDCLLILAVSTYWTWCIYVLSSECADGYFGSQCECECHCLETADICDKSTGQCQYGCAAGWSGTHCQTGLFSHILLSINQLKQAICRRRIRGTLAESRPSVHVHCHLAMSKSSAFKLRPKVLSKLAERVVPD